MSIEALLEAAKYVDRKTGEAPSVSRPSLQPGVFSSNTPPSSTSSSSGVTILRKETAAPGTLESVQPVMAPRFTGPSGIVRTPPTLISQQHTPLMRLQTDRTWAERPTVVLEKSTVGVDRPAIGVERPLFHFYQPLNDSTLLQGNTLMAAVTRENVFGNPKVSVEARTMRVAATGPQIAPINVTKPSDEPIHQPRSLHVGESQADQKMDNESVPHVMRHPGYEVSWSYSAPDVRAPSPTDDQLDNGDGNDELMTSEGEDGKKTGVRAVHNKLEKNRRAHLKECFDDLKDLIPTLQDRKVKISNTNILSGACRYIGALKRKEKELEHELDFLVREKIRKQKLLHRLKVEKGKILHVGMPWHQEGSVLTSDLLPQPSGKVNRHDRDDEDRYSTSTASGEQAEEEERKAQVETVAITMTTTITSSLASSCKTVISSSVSEPVASHGHPLKNYLLREHRAQEAMKTTTSTITTAIPSPGGHTSAAVVTASCTPLASLTIVPNMPISPGARPTVSQLLGKQTTPVRQPVRRQTPILPVQTLVNPVGYPLQRYQVPVQSFIRQSLGQQHDLAVRPSQPVVTIGVTPARPPRIDGSKLLYSQTMPVISQALKLSTGQLVNTANGLGHSLSIVPSSSFQSAFRHTAIPGVSAVSQAIMPQLSFAPTPVKQVLLADSNIVNYPTVPGLAPTLLAPFTSTASTLVSPLLTNLTTIYPRSPGMLPQRTVSLSANGTLIPSHYVMAAGTKLSNSQVASHHLTTVPVLNPRSLPHAVPKKPKTPNGTKLSRRNLLPARTKPLTTSQMAKTCMAKAGVAKSDL